MWKIYISIACCLALSQNNTGLAKNIPEHLSYCYRGNNTIPWVPNTLQILLELIRKIENTHSGYLDIKTLTVSIIHRLRLDGIEKAFGVKETKFVIPYQAHGIMTAKFETLLKLISSIPGIIKFENYLTPLEYCIFHRLISSTVEPYKRGDEVKTCLPEMNLRIRPPDYGVPRDKVQVFENGLFLVVLDKISRCPIEGGLIRTKDYGTFSPGTVIASIAASLEPQTVSIKDFISYHTKRNSYNNQEIKIEIDNPLKKFMNSIHSIDNIFAAGLAGDLAEVCMYQAPYYKTNVSVGLSGYWNDIDLPQIYYLSQNHLQRWEMTDSEILGGIDGFFMIEHIHNWINRITRLRLSQILEMYYSSRGIPNFIIENSFRSSMNVIVNEENIVKTKFSQRSTSLYDSERYSFADSPNKACERQQILNRIPREKLKEQTYFLTQIMQKTIPNIRIDNKLTKISCNSAVDKFFSRASNILAKLPNCNNISSNYRRPTVDMTVIIDGSRTKYENLKLISALSEIADVSSFGSYLTVIHGTSGEFLVSRTNSIINVFHQLGEFKGNYPTTLSLAKSFSTLQAALSSISLKEYKENVIGSKSKVVLVISQSQILRQKDFEDSKRMFEGSFGQFPDLNFIFLTNDKITFELLTSYASPVIKKQITIIESSSLEPKQFSSSILRHLRSIPKNIRIPDCDSIKRSRKIGETNIKYAVYKDLISPHQTTTYRINAHYLIGLPELRIQFQGLGYGSFTVCKTVNLKDYDCQSTSIIDQIWFNITKPCIKDDLKFCDNLIFTVEMDSSKIKCSENNCRYPDQVQYQIKFDNFLCGRGITNTVISAVFPLALVVIVLFN